MKIKSFLKDRRFSAVPGAILVIAAIFFAGCPSPTGTVAIASVSVSPNPVAVGRGGTQRFRAEVTGTGSYSTAVTWSVSAADSGTGIDANGFLTVSPYETAETLTVTAVSVADNSKSGRAEVTVTLPEDLRVWYVSAAGNDGSEGSETEALASITGALEKIGAAYAAPDPAWPGKAEGIPVPAYIYVEGNITGTGAEDSAIEITSLSAGSGDYPPIEIRGKDGDQPGVLSGGNGQRILHVKHNRVILGPNLRITGGTGDGNGGGVYIDEGGFLTLTGTEITGNSAVQGGGVYTAGSDTAPGIFNMISGSISGNATIGNPNAAGGGVYAGSYGVFTMTGGAVTGNTVDNTSTDPANAFGGAGVYVEGANGTFNIGGTAVIAANNEVRLVKGAVITLTGGFSGSVGAIDLATGSDPGLIPDVGTDWVDKPVLAWARDSGGDFPVMKFTLRYFRRGPATYGLPISIDEWYLNPADGCLKVLGDVVITSVTVIPDIKGVDQGSVISFTAAVHSESYVPQSVTWELAGSSGASTVSDEGILTVGAEESAGEMILTVASTKDPAKKKTMTLKIWRLTDGKRAWFVSVAGNDSNDGRSPDAPVKTADKAIALIKENYKTGWPQDNGQDRDALIIVSGEVSGAGSVNSGGGGLVRAENSSTSVTLPPLYIRGDSANPGSLKVTSGSTSGQRVLYLAYNRVTLGQDLVLTGGKITSETYSGAGVFTGSRGELVIEGAEITGNTCQTSGGAGASVVGGNITLKSGKIRGNRIIGASSLNPDNITIGGGVLVLGTMTMEGGEISGNSSPHHGGGVAVGQNGIFAMTGGTITENKAGYTQSGAAVAGNNKLGGGIVAMANTTVIIDGGTVEGNISSRELGQGIYIHSSAGMTETATLTLGGVAFGLNDDILLSDAAAADTNNIISFLPGASVTGAPKLSLLSLSTHVNQEYVYEWFGRDIFKWDSGNGGGFPVGSFTLGRIYSSNADYGNTVGGFQELSGNPYLEINEGTGRLTAKGSPSVTSVAVNPGTASVARTRTQEFTARLSAEGFPFREVSWSVQGTAGGTTIVPSPDKAFTAVLTVGSGEANNAILTVTAASQATPGVAGSAEVKAVDGLIHGSAHTYTGWKPLDLPSLSTFVGIVRDNGIFLVSYGGVGVGVKEFFRSVDGITWEQFIPFLEEYEYRDGGLGTPSYGLYQPPPEGDETPPPVPTWMSSYWGNWYSTDNGSTWTLSRQLTDTGSFAAALHKIVFGNNTFVGIENSSMSNKVSVGYSADGGKSWAFVSSENLDWVETGVDDILLANGYFYVFGKNGKIAYSRNGIQWTEQAGAVVDGFVPAFYAPYRMRLAYDGDRNRLIAMLGAIPNNGGVPPGKVLYTTLTNGAPGAWTEFTGINIPADAEFKEVFYADGVCLITYSRSWPPTYSSGILYSADGVEWREVVDPALEDVDVQHILYEDGTFYVSVRAGKPNLMEGRIVVSSFSGGEEN